MLRGLRLRVTDLPDGGFDRQFFDIFLSQLNFLARLQRHRFGNIDSAAKIPEQILDQQGKCRTQMHVRVVAHRTIFILAEQGKTDDQILEQSRGAMAINVPLVVSSKRCGRLRWFQRCRVGD